MSNIIKKYLREDDEIDGGQENIIPDTKPSEEGNSGMNTSVELKQIIADFFSALKDKYNEDDVKQAIMDHINTSDTDSTAPSDTEEEAVNTFENNYLLGEAKKTAQKSQKYISENVI